MSEVVGLNGNAIDHRQANEDVCSVLRDLLTRAEAGEIVSIACAYTFHDRSSAWKFTGLLCPALLGQLTKLQHEISNLL